MHGRTAAVSRSTRPGCFRLAHMHRNPHWRMDVGVFLVGSCADLTILSARRRGQQRTKVSLVLVRCPHRAQALAALDGIVVVVSPGGPWQEKVAGQHLARPPAAMPAAGRLGWPLSCGRSPEWLARSGSAPVFDFAPGKKTLGERYAKKSNIMTHN